MAACGPPICNAPTENKTGYISLSVTRDGEVFWGERAVPDLPTLLSKLEEEAVKVPQPEVRLRGDTEARYEHVGRVIYTLQRAGIQKIGFVTEPPVRGRLELGHEIGEVVDAVHRLDDDPEWTQVVAPHVFEIGRAHV